MARKRERAHSTADRMQMMMMKESNPTFFFFTDSSSSKNIKNKKIKYAQSKTKESNPILFSTLFPLKYQ